MKRRSPKAAGEIIAHVSQVMHISSGDILGMSRRIKIVTARHTAMYLTRQYLRLSMIDIARLFNRDNHSTVVNAISNVESWKRGNKFYKNILKIMEIELNDHYNDK